MNKRKKIGIGIVAVLICAGLAGAGYITFLSNESSSKVGVESPPLKMELWDSENNQWKKFDSGTLDLGTIYGTDSTSVQFKVTKLAHSEAGNDNHQIEGTFHAEMTCDFEGDDSIDLKELDKVTLHFENLDSSHSTTETWTYDSTDTDDFSITDNGKTLVVNHDTVILYSQSGYKGTATITFDQYAQGDYSISFQIL